MTFENRRRLGRHSAASAAAVPEGLWRALAMFVFVALAFALLPSFAFADVGGLQSNVESLIDDWSTALIAIGIAIVVLAVLFVGFRIMFRGGMEGMWTPVLGAIIVGNAALIAGGLTSFSG